MRSRLDRLAERVRIDWWGFATTRGGWSDSLYRFFGHGLPWDEEADSEAIVASGGFCAPSWPLAGGLGEPVWERWADWHPPWRPFRFLGTVPAIRAQRGGIVFFGVPEPSDGEAAP